MKVSEKAALEFSELDEVSERVGDFIQYWGFKRIHGKIWTHLFLSDVPLDATTLVKRLGVSKALVSFSIHDLLAYNVIREVARGRGRTVLYDANPDVTTVILGVLRLRERKMLTQVAGSLAKLEGTSADRRLSMKIGAEKMRKMNSMVSSAEHLMDFILSAGSDQKDLFNMLLSSIPQAE